MIAPVAVIPKVPLPTDEEPNTKAPPLTRLTLLAPLLESDTAPVKALLALLKVMASAPALKLEVPPTVNAPDCVIAPVILAIRF